MASPESKVKDKVKRGYEEFVACAGCKSHMWMTVQCGMGRSGVPDFLFTIQGRTLAIETKAAGKELSELQKTWRDDFISAGGYYIRMRPDKDDKPSLDKVRSMTCIVLAWFASDPNRYYGVYATNEIIEEHLLT